MQRAFGCAAEVLWEADWQIEWTIFLHSFQAESWESKAGFLPARALAKNPKRFCATSLQDSGLQYRKSDFKNSCRMCRGCGMTVIVITHNSALAPMADRLIKIKNGKVSKMEINKTQYQ